MWKFTFVHFNGEQMKCIPRIKTSGATTFSITTLVILSVANKPNMLSVFMPNVVMLSIVAPKF